MAGTEHPLVSVIMPYYHGRKYMRQALQSIMDQTYDNIEIVVVNDASPDEKDPEFIQELSHEFGFKLITHTANQGVARTMADAACASSGEYIAELSQDDLYKPEKIQRQMKELMDRDLDAVYAVGDILNMESGQVRTRKTEKIKRIIDSGVAADELKLQNLPCISLQGLLAKKSVFETDIVPIWRDYLLDDWPVNVRLFEKYNVGFIDDPLWTGRLHSNNTSRNIWKWLGPQIEVVARMAPADIKAEGVGNRLASMARRLRKQNDDQNAIVRLAFAALMLTESPEQHKKASRALKRIPSKHKKALITSKCQLLDRVGRGVCEISTPDNKAKTTWQSLGKDITNIVDTSQGAERLHEIGKCFRSLAFNIISESDSMECAVKFACAALLLMDNAQEESQILSIFQSVPGQCNKLIDEKCQLLKTNSKRSLKSFWRK